MSSFRGFGAPTGKVQVGDNAAAEFVIGMVPVTATAPE